MTTTPPYPPEPPQQPPYNGPYGSNPNNQPQQPTNPPSRKRWLVPVIIASAVVLLLLAILITVIVVSNKNDNPNPPPQTPVPTTFEPSTPASPEVTAHPSSSPRAGANDDAFVRALLIAPHDDYWGSRSRPLVIKLGYSICSAYDSGLSTTDVLRAMSSSGIPTAEQSWVRAAAVVTLCPEYKTNPN